MLIFRIEEELSNLQIDFEKLERNDNEKVNKQNILISNLKLYDLFLKIIFMFHLRTELLTNRMKS